MYGRSFSCSSYYALAFLVLGCAYFALAPVSALAQAGGGRGVSVTVNPTTGYTVVNSSTVSVPRGATVTPSAGPPSVTVRPASMGGGLSQTLPAGIEITGIREDSQRLRGPIGASINASGSALRNAATRCFTSFKCNAALMAGTIGLQALLDSVDWVMDEGAQPRPSATELKYPESPTYPVSSVLTGQAVSEGLCGDLAVCIRTIGPGRSAGCLKTTGGSSGGNLQAMSYDSSGVYAMCTYTPYNSGFTPPTPQRVPLTNSQIADTVNSNYSPQPADWPFLTGGLDFTDPGVEIEITSAPSLSGSSEPNFIEWSDGTSQGTYSEYTPTVSNNPSHKPEISIREETHKTDYDAQGNPTGTTTSTSVASASPSPQLDVPTDCEFMPTVCRFLDWFTEPDPSPDPDGEIRDLVQVYEDGGREVTVGPDSGACPAPRTIQLSLVPAVEFSFQPFCDLATAVRFWLLAIASFAAAYMTVRSI